LASWTLSGWPFIVIDCTGARRSVQSCWNSVLPWSACPVIAPAPLSSTSTPWMLSATA